MYKGVNKEKLSEIWRSMDRGKIHVCLLVIDGNKCVLCVWTKQKNSNGVR